MVVMHYIKHERESVSSGSPVPELSFLPAPYRGSTQDNLHAHAQNDAIFSPSNRGKNHIRKYFPDLACGAIFWMTTYKQQFLHSDWIKTCQLIPNQWIFTSATLTHIQLFFITISKITKEIFAKICWQLKTPTRTWKRTRCIMQISYLYASDVPFKNFCKIAQQTKKIRKKCLGKEWRRVFAVDKSTEHDKPYFDFYVFMSFTTISISKKMFSFRAQAKKRHCATH